MDEIDKAIAVASKKNLLRIGLFDIDTGKVVPWVNSRK